MQRLNVNEIWCKGVKNFWVSFLRTKYNITFHMKNRHLDVDDWCVMSQSENLTIYGPCMCKQNHKVGVDMLWISKDLKDLVHNDQDIVEYCGVQRCINIEGYGYIV